MTMADVRCPMCSAANSADAVVCSVCGARLKPMVAGESEAAPGAPEPQEGEGGDWLARIRSEAEKKAGVPSEAPPRPGEPDWLSRLRTATGEEEGPPEGEMPEWLSEEAAPAPSPAAESSGLAEAEVPDWLARIRERQKSEVEAAAEEETPPPADEDWLGKLRKEEFLPTEEEPPVAAEPEPPPPPPPVRPAPRPPLSVTPPAPAPASILPTPTPPKISAPAPAPPERITPPSIGKPAISAEDKRMQTSPFMGVSKDLLEGAMPKWLEDAGSPSDESLPHVPALVAEEGMAVTPESTPDLEPANIDIPDWLGDLRKDAGSAVKEAGGSPDNLAPATLPAWLEAMRPMDTFRPVVEIQPEDEQEVESAGPLAGLRGVLLAEPAIAMPRPPSYSGARLEVTERQFALADLLHRMVDEEASELPPKAPARRRLPFSRWAITIILLLAVALPALVGAPSLSVPTLVPLGLPALIGLIDTLPADRPVLLVFDYEPAYSGELDAVAGPLLEDLMQRDIRLATVSTRPSGPPLAERLIRRIGDAHGYLNGQDYVHLGYLPGGPAAVQLFARDPRESLAGGFLLAGDPSRRGLWSTPVLAGVQQFSDFGAVVVIAAGTEIARTWVEQAGPWTGASPLVMVASAGIEPLIRPYYEALNPQVDAILSGLPAAVAYEQANRRSGDARILWDSFGTGMMVVELALILGGVYGAASFLLRLTPGAGEE